MHVSIGDSSSCTQSVVPTYYVVNTQQAATITGGQMPRVTGCPETLINSL